MLNSDEILGVALSERRRFTEGESRSATSFYSPFFLVCIECILRLFGAVFCDVESTFWSKKQLEHMFGCKVKQL